MIIHVMLDLETWGTEPGCDLRSIGACCFDPITGHIGDRNPPLPADMEPLSFYIATDNPTTPQGADYWDGITSRKYPLTRDPRTVQWWSEQSAEAQAAFADPVDLREGLQRFTAWCNMVTEGNMQHMRLWSHGPAFDPPILEAAYRAVGLMEPWHYRAPRDTRTCFDMAGIDPGPDGSYGEYLTSWQHPGMIEHHALDDAIVQARAVCAAYYRTRSIRHVDDMNDIVLRGLAREDMVRRIKSLCEEGTQAHGDEFYSQILDIIGLTP